MASIETRPFAVASQSSVHLDIRLKEPAVDISELAGEWEYGQDVVAQIDARILDSFWEETGLTPGEDVRLTATAKCFSARASWFDYANFVHDGDGWVASVTVRIDGMIASEEAKIDAVISGKGRTRSEDQRFAFHDHAKLWESHTYTIPLEEIAGFPTSAMSFSDAGMPRVPWIVEADDGVEPEQSYSSAIRLYINTDLETGVNIVETNAADDVFHSIETEIQFALIHALARNSDVQTEVELLEIAEEDSSSVAALGAQYSENLGLSLLEAMRIAKEEPLRFFSISREKLGYLHRKARKK